MGEDKRNKLELLSAYKMLSTLSFIILYGFGYRWQKTQNKINLNKVGYF